MAINYSILNHTNLLTEMSLKYQYEKKITKKFIFEKVLTCFFHFYSCYNGLDMELDIQPNSEIYSTAFKPENLRKLVCTSVFSCSFGQ